MERDQLIRQGSYGIHFEQQDLTRGLEIVSEVLKGQGHIHYYVFQPMNKGHLSLTRFSRLSGMTALSSTRGPSSRRTARTPSLHQLRLPPLDHLLQGNRGSSSLTVLSAPHTSSYRCWRSRGDQNGSREPKAFLEDLEGDGLF